MGVAIIDSGGANIASMIFALERLGVDAQLTRDADVIRASDHVFLPGVGAAGDVMSRLTEAGLDGVIPTLSQPVLGICVGLQILFARSEEGPVDCLGVFGETVRPLEGADDRPIPHMGWNRVHPLEDCPLFRGLGGHHFYFVHSYAAPVCDETVATTAYGDDFTAAAARRNFYGVQFHPERSGADGARLLANFLEIQG